MKPFKKQKGSREYEILYGLHPVQTALKYGKRKLIRLYHNRKYDETGRIDEILALARNLGVPVRKSTNSQMKLELDHVAHQGIALCCSPLPELSWESLRETEKCTLNALTVLDQVEDPQNLGAIIRSCGFFRIKALVITRKNSCPITPCVSKASAGVAEWFPVITVNNLTRFLNQRKKEGYWVVGLDVVADKEIQDLELDRPMILVIGSEGQGLRPLVRKTCDWLVRINGNEYVESLNVSNAAAIALHTLSLSIDKKNNAKGL